MTTILHGGAYAWTAGSYLSRPTTGRFDAGLAGGSTDAKKTGFVSGLHDGKRRQIPHSEQKMTMFRQANETFMDHCRGGMIWASGWGFLNADMDRKIKEYGI